MQETPPQFMFVITFGRTGSTLLQGLLNSMPDVAVFGENNGALLSLMEAYQALRKANGRLKKPANDRPDNPWYGASRYNDDFLAREFRAFTRRLLFSSAPDGARVRSKIVGFKEIRHVYLGEGRLRQYLESLLAVFPGCKFLFLTRNAADVLASGWWTKNDPGAARKQIAEFVQTISAFSRENPGRCLTVDYRGLTAGPAVYMRIARFIGVKTTPAKYAAVISRDHSYDNRKLTGLLAKRSASTVLHDDDWWRSSVDEFEVEAIRAAGEIAVKGLLLLRTDVDAPELFIKHGDFLTPLKLDVQTAQLKDRFPFNRRAHMAGFAVRLRGTVEEVMIQDKQGTPLASVRVRSEVSAG